MGMFNNLMKRHGESGSNSKSQSSVDKNSDNLVSVRAKALIEELVSPLSQPNQKVIDEVLTIITQSSSLPDHLVNKDEVLKITKALLFQLVEPISNPNKQLIDELLFLVTSSKTKSAQNQNNNLVQSEQSLKQEAMNSSEPVSKVKVSSGVEEQRLIKGQAGLRMQKDDAMAQAPFPSDLDSIKKKDEKKQKETRSIMNLLLEQIKELITITNNLNTKIKSQQVRLDTLDTNFSEFDKKSQEFDERMIAFEKNMEKFIGLYEVVTNQYNPFVETTDAGYNNAGTSPVREHVNTTSEVTPAPVVEERPVFKIDNNIITDLDTLSDYLIGMSDDDFNLKIISKKDELEKWLKEVLNKEDFANELLILTTRNEFIKRVMKEIHSQA